jgi:hypothetical protein
MNQLWLNVVVVIRASFPFIIHSFIHSVSKSVSQSDIFVVSKQVSPCERAREMVRRIGPSSETAHSTGPTPSYDAL